MDQTQKGKLWGKQEKDKEDKQMGGTKILNIKKKNQETNGIHRKFMSKPVILDLLFPSTCIFISRKTTLNSVNT